MLLPHSFVTAKGLRKPKNYIRQGILVSLGRRTYIELQYKTLLRVTKRYDCCTY